MLRAKDLTEEAFHIAEKTIKNGKSMPALILIHTKDNPALAIPYKDGSLPHQMQQVIIIKLIKAARAIKVFEGVVLVSEAWMAKAPNEEMVGVLRPSLDPDRTEGIIAYAFAADHTKSVIMADIKRDNGNVTITRRDMDLKDMKSWLDDAFED